jgi:predicted  nucleic acid-binding Zn-ribbon protein
MTTNPLDRLDRIEATLDRIAAQGEITDARLDRIAAQGEITDARLDRIAAQGEITDARLDRITTTQERDRTQLQEDIDICFQLNRQTAESLNRLTERMDIFEQQAEVDREDFRSTFTSLLEALNERFRSNGHS